MREMKELLVRLSEEEIQRRKDEHYEVSRALATLQEEKSNWLSNFRVRCKPHKDREKDLRTTIDNRGELRQVECEYRPGLVNGTTDIIRLDTLELVETISEDPEDDAPVNQPGLPFAAPRAPALRCTGVDADGECFQITAEQADAADREIRENGVARVETGDATTGAYRALVKVLRGKACETCGIVAPHHRPECASLKAEEAQLDAEVTLPLTEEEATDDGPDDGEAILAKLEAVEPQSDSPRARAEAQGLVPTKPKRRKAKADEAGEVH